MRMPDTRVAEQLSRYRAAVDMMFLILELDDHCSLSELLQALQTFRGREIRLQPYADMPSPFTGMVLIGSGYDLICYRTNLSPHHTLQVICHELIHLVRGHTDIAAAMPMSPKTRKIPDDLLLFCGRSAYANIYEFEAEYSATYLANKLGCIDSMPRYQLKQEHAILKSLHEALRPIAPTVYLDLPDDDNLYTDECLISRLLSEITDARLLCYTSRRAQSSLIGSHAASHNGRTEGETLAAIARWEAQLLRRLQHGDTVANIPSELLTAPYQSIEYYRLLAIAVASTPTAHYAS
jgi:hypothetical protein